MKICTLTLIVLLMAMASCSDTPENIKKFPKVIPDTGNIDQTQPPQIKNLGVVMALRVAYHLEDGYSKKRGLTLICQSGDKQYTVAFYKPEDERFVLLGKPVPFEDKHPAGTAYNDRTAVKGIYKGKKRVAYIDSGRLIIDDE